MVSGERSPGIEESDVFKEDYEFVKTVIEQLLEETKTQESEHNSQLELERLKLERVKAELELAQLGNNASKSETSFNKCETETSIDVFIKSVRTLTIKVPSKSEGWGYFFASLERAYNNKNVPERFKAEILLNLLGERASNILTYITDKELNNYEEIKAIVLREFEPTAQAVLKNFRNACRENETHVQFASRLTTNFDYYLKLRKVTDFDTLKELIILDKMFQTLDRETAAHINIRQSGDWFRPLQLGKECDLYFTSSAKECFVRGEKRSFPDNPEVVNKSPPDGECSWSVPPQVGCQGFVSTNLVENKKNVILSTVLCLIKDKYSQWQKVRCLLDVGSQINLISNECLQRLQLKGEKINQSISCINNTSLTVNRGVKASIANESKSFKRNISMLVVQKITDLIPNKFFDAHVQIPESVRLADPNFKIPGKIDILLSAEYFYDVIKPGKINVKNSNLILQDSVFGYIVGGSVEDEPNLYSCGLICGSEELNSNLRKFWEIEEIDNELPKNLENSICEEHYAQTHKRDESGKYIVSIPFKEHWSCLGNSKDIALKRLESLWTRFSRDQDYQKLYRDFLKEYEELGHMTEITESVEPEYIYYMPHHGIYRPQKSTTKLRTVFNASALTANGRSLNSIQYNGGVIQDDLFSLLVRFRKHIYAFTADIRQMYRMIDVDVSQRPLQRILWKGDVNEPVKCTNSILSHMGRLVLRF
ncbi:DUF1758 domain-containing protein [Trichonephila clavipes]|nr:DUF1758 domain-containing protein [Trichonephila clavipes]